MQRKRYIPDAELRKGPINTKLVLAAVLASAVGTAALWFAVNRPSALGANIDLIQVSGNNNSAMPMSDAVDPTEKQIYYTQDGVPLFRAPLQVGNSVVSEPQINVHYHTGVLNQASARVDPVELENGDIACDIHDVNVAVPEGTDVSVIAMLARKETYWHAVACYDLLARGHFGKYGFDGVLVDALAGVYAVNEDPKVGDAIGLPYQDRVWAASAVSNDQSEFPSCDLMELSDYWSNKGRIAHGGVNQVAKAAICSE